MPIERDPLWRTFGVGAPPESLALDVAGSLCRVSSFESNTERNGYVWIFHRTRGGTRALGLPLTCRRSYVVY